MDPIALLEELFTIPNLLDLKGMLRQMYSDISSTSKTKTETARRMGTNRRTLDRMVQSDFQTVRDSTARNIIRNYRVMNPPEPQLTGTDTLRIPTDNLFDEEVRAVAPPDFPGNEFIYANVVVRTDITNEYQDGYKTIGNLNARDYYRFTDRVGKEGGIDAKNVAAVSFQYRRIRQ